MHDPSTPAPEHLIVPTELVTLWIAAIEATRAWSALPYPIAELDPAMQQLREALRSLLKWQQALAREGS
jgi:hypothetical protein